MVKMWRVHSDMKFPSLGGFYQNTFGHHGTLTENTGCLPCPNGTYVELDKIPGKHQHDCRVCPAGE